MLMISNRENNTGVKFMLAASKPPCGNTGGWS
mgnify:CR=1 FL=1